MNVAVLGSSHLAQTLRRAYNMLGLCDNVTPWELAFIAEDVLDHGSKNQLLAAQNVFDMAHQRAPVGTPLVVTSQVPPGTTRAWAQTAHGPVYYQVDTLIVAEALHRAIAPEQIIIGAADPKEPLPLAYQAYLSHFKCWAYVVTYEEAELTKCAINYMLAAQIDAANKLSAAAAACGAEYKHVERLLRNDARIGPKAYLHPGKINQHLKRDVDTVEFLLRKK